MQTTKINNRKLLLFLLHWVHYCPVIADNYLRLGSYYIPSQTQEENDKTTTTFIASYNNYEINGSFECNVTNQTTTVDNHTFGTNISSNIYIGRNTTTAPVDYYYDINNNHDNNGMCRTYLAPSTIPGAGLGLFAGVNFENGDEVTSADVIVPLRDILWNNDFGTSTYFLWDEYTWDGKTFPGMEEPGHRVVGASFGIGAVPNCFFPKVNVEEGGDQVVRDYAGLDHTNSPGIGAFTPFHGRSSYATEKIPAYSELFVDYGYRYFETREEIYGLIPFLEDFDEADKMLSAFLKTIDKLERRQKVRHFCGAEYGSEVHANDDQYCGSDTMGSLENDLMRSSLYDLSREIIGNFPSRTLLALPEDHNDIEEILSIGGTIHKDDQERIRDLAYLQEHGECMDNLEVKPSTIPEAGRGAFARRNISKGSVVAPLPLIHLPDRSVLDVHQAGPIDPETHDSTLSEHPIHSQLLLNYCFGHEESSLLLCPYGVVSSMVNHAPAMPVGEGSAANVKLVWSEKMTTHHEWREQPLSAWAYNYQTGLSFEYIALRDIKEGEEVLVDYGHGWQEAWNDHVTNWQASKRLIDDLNDDIDSILPLHFELQYSTGDLNENPNAVNLWCYSAYREMRGLPRADEEAYPCKIILRQEDEMAGPFYTAEIIIQAQNDDDLEGTCYEIFDEIMFAVPRDAFAFGGHLHVNDTREYIQTKSFRHELLIPDNMFPDVWRNHRKIPL